MNDRDTMRICLALAASVLFHGFLLGAQLTAANDSRTGLTASNSLHVNIVPAAKRHPHQVDALQRTTSKHPKDTAIRKIHKPLDADEQKTISQNKTEKPAPGSSMQDGQDAARAIGAALNSMTNQQYIMMRLQQFFSMSRESANSLITNRFVANEMAHYQGMRCTLRLVTTPVPEPGYEIAQPECDDPDLTAKLKAIPWNTAMPLPSWYSLPYRGMVIYLNIGSYDVSIGLEPIVN